MWWSLVIGCDGELYGAAFNWKIDRTLVVGVSVVPAEAEGGVPRQIDALVLSPHRVTSVRSATCGLLLDRRVEVNALCAPEMLVEIGEDPPFTWVPPVVEFPCPPPVEVNDFVGNHYVVETPCASTVGLYVTARSTDDVGQSVVPVVVSAVPVTPSQIPDRAAADPRIEVVNGEPRAGADVTLRFSLAADWPVPPIREIVDTSASDTGAPSDDSYLTYSDFAWWVDDGVLLGTGRTLQTGVTAEGRPFSENTLRVPRTWHGPLTVAVVYGAYPMVWAVTDLEVP